MLKTEMRNPLTTHIDQMTTSEMLSAIQHENEVAATSVRGALPALSAFIDDAFPHIKNGGRLFYIGCGTSGRLGVIDAAECPPTYGVDYSKVVGIIAGGDATLRRAAEGEEDDPKQGEEDLKKYALTKDDVVVGISVAGGAAYVIAALRYAKSQGCVTAGLSSNEDAKLKAEVDHFIFTDTGAEAITGSTRMKAGSAHKMVLNMISTSLMVKCGYVYENMMINLKPTNVKLKARVIRITASILNCSEEEATQKLIANDWNIRKAVSK